MSTFICYSHVDRDFVDTCAKALVMRKVKVWVDRWELNVGDSLVQHVQDAIGRADVLMVVLSKASVNSEWCKKELSVGLMRELEEKRVLVLPVVIEDCEIPLLLRDKIFADFRQDFGVGMGQILEAIARIVSQKLGRLDDKEYITDFSFAWGDEDGQFVIFIYLISHPNDGIPITILTTSKITADHNVSQKLFSLRELGIEEHAKNMVLLAYLNSQVLLKDDTSVELSESEPAGRTISLTNPKNGDTYTLSYEVRRLGEDTGKNVIYHAGDVLNSTFSLMVDRSPKPDPVEMILISEILDNGVERDNH